MVIMQMIEGKRIYRTERQFERKLKDLQISKPWCWCYGSLKEGFTALRNIVRNGEDRVN